MISAEYLREQELLHENPNYGVASLQYAPIITEIINKSGVRHVLDYGAGKGRLGKALRPEHEITVHHYDPAITDWADSPDSAQLVACIDVLEHIEPEHLDSVLDDLQRCLELIGFFSIHTGPAVKKLSDGRNAHLIQAGPEWWLPKIMERFELLQMNSQSHGFYVVVRPYGDN